MLEDVEMPPGQDFGVVVAKGQPGVFGAAHGLPELGRLPNLQKDRPAFPLEAALDHFPVQSQTQQFMKQFFRRHARRLPSIPPKTAENQPVFGIINSVLGFRQFRLRGVAKVTLEWTLVCVAYNLKRLHRLSAGELQVSKA